MLCGFDSRLKIEPVVWAGGGWLRQHIIGKSEGIARNILIKANGRENGYIVRGRRDPTTRCC